MLYSTVLSEFGKLDFFFNEDGTLKILSELNRDVTFIVVIKSLDCNLSAAICYHESFVGYDQWTFNYTIDLFKDPDHPGFQLEIYDKTFQTLIHKKLFAKKIKSTYPKLSSNYKEVSYSPYHDFFYNDVFQKSVVVKDNDVIYDLGANIGIFSLYCSNFDIDSIYAFEPNPETFNHLKTNCEKYGKNVTCFEKAVGKTFTQASFSSPQRYSAGGKINEVGDYTVNVINLETFIEVNQLKKPTIFKIDIEGGEFDVFDSTSDKFFENTHTVCFDFHGHHDKVRSIISRFERLGYKITGSVSDSSMLGVLYFTR